MKYRTAPMIPGWQEGGLTEVDHSPLDLGDETPWVSPDSEVSATLAPPQRVGRHLGQYVMYEEIARGGMAAVHLGRSLAPGAPRAVAIKHLYPQLAWSPSFVAMFLDEGRLAARVRHPNVVAPLDFVVRAREGELYLVMEYVHGETLADLLGRALRRGRPPSAAVAVGIMAGALQGLHAAHEATTDEGTPLEIVHRDVSPPNLMVGCDGIARVLDFGVAKATVQDLPMNQQELRGKPSYLAPEQIRGQSVDRRADVFSAGLVLWETLAGRRLFDQGDPRVVAARILSSEIPPPSRFNPAVPAALDHAVLKAVNRERERRYPTASAFAAALTQALRPATASEIGAWVEQVSGDVLASRAERVREIVEGRRELPLAPRWQQVLRPVERLGRSLADRRRWVGLGMVGVALVSLGLWSAAERGRAAAPLGASVALAAMAPAAPACKTRQDDQTSALVPPAPLTAAPSPVEVAPRRESAAAPTEVAKADEDTRAGAAKTPEPAKAADPANAAAARAPALAKGEAARGELAEAAHVEGAAATDVAPGDRADVATAGLAEAPAEIVPDAAPARGRIRHTHAARKAVLLSRIGAMDDRALEAYRRGEIDSARRLLYAALAACSSGGLDHHRIKAVTHARLGVVLVGGYKQSELAVEQFRKALLIDRNVPLSRRDVKPEVAAAIRQAVART